MAGNVRPFSAVFASLLLATVGSAHDSLYHYLEIRIPREPEVIEVTFSIHAADLDLARKFGADPAGAGFQWLQECSDGEIAAFLDSARSFITSTFTLSVDGKGGESFAKSLRFPTAVQLRDSPESIEGARPGFLVGVLELTPAAVDLKLDYAKAGGKRLLVVLNRPGAFPLVRDLAPGDSARFSLTSSSP